MANPLTPRQIVQSLIDAAAMQVPGIGGTLRLIIDSLIFPTFLDGWLFPKPDPDIFKQFEKRIEKIIDRRVQAMVGQATFDRVSSRLKGLADAFRDFANVVEPQERRVRTAYLITLANASITEVEAVPDRYLHLLTDPLQFIAILHIAILLDQVKMYPDHYEYQLALNKAAINYSDLAGRIRDRFLWYRLGQIADGIGLLEETETARHQLPGQPEMKKVLFNAYDDLWHWWEASDSLRWQFLYPPMETDWVQAVGEDIKYYNMKKAAQTAIETYAKAEEKQVYDWWGEHLTDTTAAFMQFVDWDGEHGKRKPKDRMKVLTFPVQPASAVNGKTAILERIDLWLGQQMDQFAVSGPRYLQTYRLPGEVKFGDQGNIFYRADTYDTAVAAIYLTLRGDLRRACDLADGLCVALEHDSLGGGRIMAATKATALLDEDNSYATSVFYPDGATRDIGNMAWAGIALTRLYAKTSQYRYLYNALIIGNWITANCAVTDACQGFSGGEDAWGNKRLWRSVEHNTDVYALFLNLHALTQDAAWLEAANRAKTLVLACRVAKGGFYVTGTGEDQTLNNTVVPTDTQSWTALAGINPDGNALSLNFMLAHFSTTTAGFAGFKFAYDGSGVQNEVTAGAAMALHLQGGAFCDQAAGYFDSLAKQQTDAPNTDGLGLVATPGQEADTGKGLGWKYYNWLHAASTAWTGLAFLARDNPDANPYQTVHW